MSPRIIQETRQKEAAITHKALHVNLYIKTEPQLPQKIQKKQVFTLR